MPQKRRALFRTNFFFVKRHIEILNFSRVAQERFFWLAKRLILNFFPLSKETVNHPQKGIWWGADVQNFHLYNIHLDILGSKELQEKPRHLLSARWPKSFIFFKLLFLINISEVEFM